MKICFINTALFGSDGISRVLSVLTTELAKEHDVTVVTFENPEKVNRNRYNLSKDVHVDFWPALWKKCYVRRAVHKFNQKSAAIKKLNSKFVYDWIYLPRFMQDYWTDYINAHEFDVVVGVQAKLGIILGSIKERIHCKTFGWQHNSYEAYLENQGKYYWNQDFLFDTYLTKLDGYVVLNEHDEMRYRQTKGMETVTIYNPKSFVSESKSSCREKRFICVGGLRPAKGFDYGIEAFAEFSMHNSEWTLDIYGGGEDHDKLESMIHERHLEDRIHLRGVSDKIQEELLHSGCFLLPSRWEGMPMVVLEAMEMGLPTISFDITAINPLVTDGIEGAIVKKFDVAAFSNAMLQIAQNDELRMQYGRNAGKKVEQFNVDVISKKWDELFRKECASF